MKIFIMADMEGATGIASRQQTDPGHPQYALGRRLLAGDVNAAVAGAFDGGATEVIVADAHGSSFNIPPEDLDPRARLLVGSQTGPRLAFVDRGISGVFLVAYHAMAGTLRATLEHTMSSEAWHSVRVNGIPVGEVGIDAGMAAEAGVPTVLVTGDDKVCAEAAALLGGIETACVKQGIGRHRALCLSPAQSAERIRGTAQRAVERLGRNERFRLIDFGSPATVSITYKHTELADAAAVAPNARRVDGYTVEASYECFSAWYGGIWKDGPDNLDHADK